MNCELCKQRAATQGMGAVLKDVNGNISIVLCQSCLKKLKNAVRSELPQDVEIYPINTNVNNGEKNVTNLKVRRALSAQMMRYWQLAKILGVSEMTLTRKLRDELPDEEQNRLVQLINEYAAKKDENHN